MAQINLPYPSGISLIYEYEDCTSNSWVDQVSGHPLDIYSPILHDDCVEFVGSETSYAKLTYGGTSGGNAENSDYCIRYALVKNLSQVYSNWRTVFGNETANTYCSTIAMDSSGVINFTRQNIIQSGSYKYINDWHVIAWTSNKITGQSALYIDGTKIGVASGCDGWAADTYFFRGSSWYYNNNNTAIKCFIVGDTIPSDSEIQQNSWYLYNKYFASWSIDDSDNIVNEYFIDMPEYVMTEPYPSALWRVNSQYNQGFPYNEVAPETDKLGAFANATRLRRVSIPKSCKKIGKEAFRNTALKSVTISRDCEYFSTSFPDRCVVHFYPD